VIVGALVSSVIGVILLAAGLFGYLIRPCTLWHRALLLVAALLLIKPGWESDVVGLALLLVVLASQYFAKVKGVRNEPA